MSKLRIVEIFTSIQGEGMWVGIPSTFVRVSGCNLRCRWCDTPYASWEPEGPMMEIAEIVEAVQKAGVEHVVLTGGEPMLFEHVAELADKLHEHHVITIETAGTVHREIACDLMSISPKLAGSAPEGDWHDRHEKTRLNREPLIQLSENYACQFKFVVNPEGGLADIDEIKELLAEMPDVESSQVMLMAEGTDAETLHRRERLLVPICLENNWRLTPRLHIDLFGDTRGT